MKFIIILLLVTVISQLIIRSALAEEGTFCRVQIRPKLSAIGIRWDSMGYIRYIDPQSDLYGKIDLNDRLLLVNGIAPNAARHQNQHLGVAGTAMILTIQTRYGVYQIPAIRHPLTQFSPVLAAELVQNR